METCKFTTWLSFKQSIIHDRAGNKTCHLKQGKIEDTSCCEYLTGKDKISFFAVLGMELKAFFALGIFRIGSQLYYCDGLDDDSPIYASCIAGMTGMHHHAQLVIG
jgi:hypothetical protein